MIRIKVSGIPAPQGSKRHVGHGIMVESSKAVGPWREAIRSEAQREDGRFGRGVPVRVAINFYMPRPQGHYGTGRNAQKVKPSAPGRPASLPDIDKLVRAVLDGIVMGGLLADDSQVASLHADKFYADETFVPGCVITVIQLD